MAQLFEDTVQKILSHFQEQHVSEVVITGEAGAGKTWVARKVCDSAFKEGLSYGSIWISPAENPEKKDLLDIIASQLSVSSCAEEWDDNEDNVEVKDKEDMEQGTTLEQMILGRLEVLRTGKPKNPVSKDVQDIPQDMEVKKSQELAHEVATGKLSYLLVVLDDVIEEEEDIILSDLKRILHPNLLKILITRKVLRDSNVCATSEGKEDSVRPDAIQLRRLSPEEALALLQERLQEHIKAKVYMEQLKAVSGKGFGLPAAVILIAEALNHIGRQDRGRALENAVEDAADLKGEDIIGVLRFVYEMLPEEGVTRSCYWLSRQLFTYRDAVHFNKLITFWILEGCFNHCNCVEKAYEEGYCVLKELKDWGMLKGHCSNYVYMERAMPKLPDERRDGLCGAAKLGLADVLRSDGLGKIVLADGMTRSVYKDKEQKELSTVVIDGTRLSKEDSEEFFRSMKGLKVLAVLNPMFEYLPPGLTELKDLEVLVLRGCQHLKEADEICNLTKLSFLKYREPLY